MLLTKNRPDMFLTYLGSLEGDEENQIENEEPETKSGQRFYVAACPRLEGKNAKAQRYVFLPSLILSLVCCMLVYFVFACKFCVLT